MGSNVQYSIIWLVLLCGCSLVAQNKQTRFARTSNTGLPVYFPLAKKDFVKMSSAYGDRYHPVQHKMKKHQGLDLVAKMGKPVYASAAGLVLKSDWDSGYGNRVILLHFNGVKTLYGHLSKSEVRRAQLVKAGEVIGFVGDTGQTTGPHLHYEIWVKSKKINPLAYWAKMLAENNKQTGSTK